MSLKLSKLDIELMSKRITEDVQRLLDRLSIGMNQVKRGGILGTIIRILMNIIEWVEAIFSMFNGNFISFQERIREIEVWSGSMEFTHFQSLHNDVNKLHKAGMEMQKRVIELENTRGGSISIKPETNLDIRVRCMELELAITLCHHSQDKVVETAERLYDFVTGKDKAVG